MTKYPMLLSGTCLSFIEKNESVSFEEADSAGIFDATPEVVSELFFNKTLSSVNLADLVLTSLNEIRPHETSKHMYLNNRN